MRPEAVICESCQAGDHGRCAERWCSWCDCPCNGDLATPVEELYEWAQGFVDGVGAALTETMAHLADAIAPLADGFAALGRALGPPNPVYRGERWVAADGTKWRAGGRRGRPLRWVQVGPHREPWS